MTIIFNQNRVITDAEKPASSFVANIMNDDASSFALGDSWPAGIILEQSGQGYTAVPRANPIGWQFTNSPLFDIVTDPSGVSAKAWRSRVNAGSFNIGAQRYFPTISPLDGITFTWQLVTYFPPGFDFTVSTDHQIKWMRNRRRTNGSIVGDFEVLYRNGGVDGVGGQFLLTVTGPPLGQPNILGGPISAVKTGVAQVWTEQFYWSKTSSGRFRFWGGDYGQPQTLYIDFQGANLYSGTNDIGAVFWIDYWNGGAPLTQDAYAVASYVHVGTDFPFVGSVPGVLL